MTDAQDWRPSAPLAVAELRAELLTRIRAYFVATGAIEVDTPALSTTAISDPNIESLRVHIDAQPAKTYYLHTSPEYPMKRLLCAGYPDIYQICKVFRDGEVGRNHQPEFTLLEWYRHDDSLESIIDDSVQVIAHALDDTSLQENVERYDYCAAFARFADCDPLTADVQELQRIAQADASLRAALGDDKNAWLDLLLSQRVMPAFNHDRVTILTHYPIDQAALARACPADASVADRFELFYQGRELANGYVELRDSDTQRQRFEADLVIRRNNDSPVAALDETLLAAMAAGLPACAGVALGVDRLLMIAADADDIRQVTTFPFAE